MEVSVCDNKCLFILDKKIYDSNVIYKCFYWYTGDFNVDIAIKDDHFCVTLMPTIGVLDIDAIKSKVQRDLIDFNLRDIITKETQTIRELIVAKAFANYEFKSDNPTGEISDPVGFDPSII